MEFQISLSVDGIDADAIAVGIQEGSEFSDPRFAAVANPLFASGDLPLKPLETLMIPGTPKIIFVGIARAADAEAWRRAAATVVRRLKKVRKLAFTCGDVRAIVEGALIGSFSVEAYKTADSTRAVERILLVGGDRLSLDQGKVFGESVNWA